jgi:hypothetical protein
MIINVSCYLYEKPSFWFTFAKLWVNSSHFRQSRASTWEKTRFLRSVGQGWKLRLIDLP